MARPVINEIALGKTAYRVWALGNANFEPQTFLGDFAFDRASDYLEGLLSLSEARQVWLLRYSRQTWQVVLGVEKDPASAEWGPIPLPELTRSRARAGRVKSGDPPCKSRNRIQSELN
jgi:hypothetical protein